MMSREGRSRAAQLSRPGVALLVGEERNSCPEEMLGTLLKGRELGRVADFTGQVRGRGIHDTGVTTALTEERAVGEGAEDLRFVISGFEEKAGSPGGEDEQARADQDSRLAEQDGERRAEEGEWTLPMTLEECLHWAGGSRTRRGHGQGARRLR